VTRPTGQKKSARELRQEGSYYRCCIPALAGFVSPQSIAPDGNRISPYEARCATRKPGAVRGIARRISKRISALTVDCASVCIDRVKWPALLLLLGLFEAATSCTTLVNQRDLYSPEPSSGSLEAARQWYGATSTSTVTGRSKPTAETAPAPDFRY
jgi:hypothetical protein